MDELTYILCREHGKNWDEARGDILKVKEPVEVACGAPSLMMGESLMNVTNGFDSVLYREPMGVFAGIVPFNFPAMIPMGWMMPMCIATHPRRSQGGSLQAFRWHQPRTQNNPSQKHPRRCPEERQSR